ncbi:MAG: hypothetical protein ACKPKO_46110, partial [Candidatus Fonsibacter sp.]
MARKNANAYIKDWTDADQNARMEFGVKGFAAVKKGLALYLAANAHHSACAGSQHRSEVCGPAAVSCAGELDASAGKLSSRRLTRHCTFL